MIDAKGDHAAAEAMLREALAITREVSGAGGGRGLGSRLDALANLLLNRGDHAGAEPLLRESIEVYRKVYGPEHPTQLSPLRNLHRLYTMRGDRVAADAAQLDVLRVEVAHFTQEMRALPRNVHTVMARADCFARMGRFPEALADWERAMTLDPASYDACFAAAIEQLQPGDVDAYRAAAGEMLRRFADTDNHEVADRTAKAYLLSPHQGADFDQAVALADRALALNRDVTRVGWFELTKAMAEYRAGRYAETLDWLAKFRTHSSLITYGDRSYPEGTGLASAGMAHHRLGHLDEARRNLDESTRLMDQCPKLGEADLGPGPENRLVWEIFMREAHTLIGSPEATSASTFAGTPPA